MILRLRREEEIRYLESDPLRCPASRPQYLGSRIPLSQTRSLQAIPSFARTEQAQRGRGLDSWPERAESGETPRAPPDASFDAQCDPSNARAPGGPLRLPGP